MHGRHVGLARNVFLHPPTTISRLLMVHTIVKQRLVYEKEYITNHLSLVVLPDEWVNLGPMSTDLIRPIVAEQTAPVTWH